MTNSFVNFWQMVIEKKVKIIVNLTSVEKDGAEDKYFPDKNLNLENNIKLELKKTEVKDLQVKRYSYQFDAHTYTRKYFLCLQSL